MNNNDYESDYNIDDDDTSILVIDESEGINPNDEIMIINNIVLESRSKDIDLQNHKENKDSIDKIKEFKEVKSLLSLEKPDKPFKSIFEVIKINKVFKRNDIDPRNILNKRTRYSNLIEKKYF